MFGADCFGLYSLSGSSSLEKIASSSFSSQYLPSTLHLGVGPCGYFLIHISMSPGVVTVQPTQLPWSHECSIPVMSKKGHFASGSSLFLSIKFRNFQVSLILTPIIRLSSKKRNTPHLCGIIISEC